MSTRLPIPEGCLNVTCIRCRMGSMEAWPPSSSLWITGRSYNSTCNGHRWSPQAESCTDCGAAEARTRMAGVQTSLDRNNMPGRVTRRLRLECGERPAGRDWTGSTAETQGGPGRAGPRSKMYRWMGGHATACQQTTATEHFRNGSYSPIKGLSRIKRGAISGPILMNTSDTTALSCGEPCIRSERSWAGVAPSTSYRPTSLPALRTDLHPYSTRRERLVLEGTRDC